MFGTLRTTSPRSLGKGRDDLFHPALSYSFSSCLINSGHGGVGVAPSPVTTNRYPIALNGQSTDFPGFPKEAGADGFPAPTATDSLSHGDTQSVFEYC